MVAPSLQGQLPEPLVWPPARAHASHALPSFYQHLLINSVPNTGQDFEDTTELPILGIKGARGGRANEAGVKEVSLRTGPAG